MDIILVKIFATALALSQVGAKPDAVKTQFDPAQDQAQVVQLLRDGCAHMRKAFNIEKIDLDDLIVTAMSDKRAAANDVKAFRGIKFNDLYVAYRQFCKNEDVENPAFDAREVIEFYNRAAADLPDHTKLKGMRPAGTTFVFDGRGINYAELFEPDNRRVWVSLDDIPADLRAAFIAAEDKRFYQHKGIDERSVIRAFMGMLGPSSKQQGGSTITQQLTKNLLVGDDVTYERKIREIIVATRVEQVLTKNEILELYLNSIYLGRSSWGVEMAARSYFGKRTKDLSLSESIMLAGLAKGPGAYSPDRNPQRAKERSAYVLTRLQEDGVIKADRVQEVLNTPPSVIAYTKPRRDNGYHYIDHIAREAKSLAGIENLTAKTYTIHSTIRPDLQRATEIALQDGLARYEQNMGRAAFNGAETNIANAVSRIGVTTDSTQPTWRKALEHAYLPLYDVHWDSAVVIDIGRGKGSSGTLRVGLRDGSILPLSAPPAAKQKLQLYDVVYVKMTDGSEKSGTRAELRIRPAVQGAAVIIENSTGRILAMAGGFSFPLSQLNRVTQARRQPGSALKPLSYLAALNNGLQPNTLVRDSPITLPPPNKSSHGRYTARDYWTPKNYDRSASGVITLRRALENSKNLVTARLLDGGIAERPEDSLERVCALAMEAQIYSECIKFYPFVLGAQPVRQLDLAGFYATIANEGARPTPFAIEAIEQDGKTVYTRKGPRTTQMTLADRPSFYQLKSILQGVLARGTARSISELSPFVAGKTGTSDEENDTWFMGFTNDVTIGVWVGYDNADGKRRTLGAGQTGSRVALPIFRQILDDSWNMFAPKTALNGPSPDASRQLAAVSINLSSGERASDRSNSGFTEYFRLDQTGKIAETQHRLVARASADTDDYEGNIFGRTGQSDSRPSFGGFGFFGQLFGGGRQVSQPADDRPSARSRRIDPDYFGFR